MTRLSYERYCAEISTQTSLLRSHLTASTDLGTPVPSCPGWDVGQAARHLGGVQRWATKVVTERATAPVPDTEFRAGSEALGHSPVALGEWLVSGAADLTAALLAAGPASPVWAPVGEGTAFYARRFTHESALHRADATLPLGVPYALDTAVALDAIDEWMELGAMPFHFEIHPWTRELLGPDRAIAFAATDVPGERWLVDLSGPLIRWSARSAAAAQVTVQAPVVDLLLLLYRRRPLGGLAVTGDETLLEFYLERVAFG